MKKIIQRIQQRMQEKRVREVKERADELFQLCENNGELWLTYAGYLVIPASLLANDPILTLKQIRQYYIESETK